MSFIAHAKYPIFQFRKWDVKLFHDVDTTSSVMDLFCYDKKKKYQFDEYLHKKYIHLVWFCRNLFTMHIDFNFVLDILGYLQ